ncbi:carbohydrate ABC transporter permease [Geminicoccus roseus]|uniref:carbohydrate ABC transporter permease n=1 Tax=Geminicoccus roseus TaxID=404900 RepID=UPI000405C516|nr:sugar ABC transporter permease [Geminicoccus roseus]
MATETGAISQGAPVGLSRPAGAARERGWRFLTLAPALVVFLGLTLLPMLNLLALSFHEVTWADRASTWRFVGLDHFRALLGDNLFRAGIVNTLIFAVVAVALQMVLGFGLALLTSAVVHGKVVYRTIFLLPILIPGIVIGAIWKLMYSFDFGIINTIIGTFGLSPQDWLGQGHLALASVIVVDVWHWTPFCFLLLLAGIESLPQDVYEAAAIDGASAWQRLVHITLPLMIPTLVVTFVFRMILAFKVFDEVYLLTGGGPGTATEVISFSIYRRFFTEDRAGYGSAMSIVTFFGIALLIILATALLRRRETRS